ncbi:hypothetical protein Val02_73310 [Virgisporangium aliadipatigenens]|uniref:Uncharacterized protein n=1 Tax=Virgisporangium aliadipatigenens TaxID=741659 RepID=A0A8J3YV68_9ACTN|nr:hypothetical protein Val02_73310 [Virgisporangium aliadipatigenens]
MGASWAESPRLRLRSISLRGSPRRSRVGGSTRRLPATSMPTWFASGGLPRPADGRVAAARVAGRLDWEEWRAAHEPAEAALQRFVEAVRLELALPPLSVRLTVSDVSP